MMTEQEQLSDRQRMDLLALYDARNSTVYGGVFDAFSREDYTALHDMGLIRSYIPAGCMAPITKLTPKGCKLIESLLSGFVGGTDSESQGRERNGNVKT